MLDRSSRPATACSVAGSIRLRASKTAPQGLAWAMVTLVFGIGAFCLLAIPARY